jgi:hypothetical protein
VDSEDGTISPARMELVTLLSEPDAYEAIVDALPRCPAKLLLQLLGLLHRFYPSRPEPFLQAGPDITLTLHVTGAPAITLIFDASDPFRAERVTLTIAQQASGVDRDTFAAAVERAAGALLTYWMQRLARPPDVQPAED